MDNWKSNGLDTEKDSGSSEPESLSFQIVNAAGLASCHPEGIPAD